ncbi:hypothetical protein COBT_002016, partial [Conglomerata obtusa]
MHKKKLYASVYQCHNVTITSLIYKTCHRLRLSPKIILTSTHLYFKSLPENVLTAVPACIGLSCKLHNVVKDYRQIISECLTQLSYVREHTNMKFDILNETLNLEIKICAEHRFDFKECSLNFAETYLINQVELGTIDDKSKKKFDNDVSILSIHEARRLKSNGLCKKEVCKGCKLDYKNKLCRICCPYSNLDVVMLDCGKLPLSMFFNWRKIRVACEFIAGGDFNVEDDWEIEFIVQEMYKMYMGELEELVFDKNKW